MSEIIKKPIEDRMGHKKIVYHIDNIVISMMKMKRKRKMKITFKDFSIHSNCQPRDSTYLSLRKIQFLIISRESKRCKLATSLQSEYRTDHVIHIARSEYNKQ